ncbi:MAG: hypothetical protein OXI50_03495, partial [Gammaproteobacteria bacterium]|nr:hypothetical protein [Gammaproteobacteria bacterium]
MRQHQATNDIKRAKSAERWWSYGLEEDWRPRAVDSIREARIGVPRRHSPDRYFIPAGVPHAARIQAGYADITIFGQKQGAMSRLTRILSATLGLMGFGAGVRESIESPAPEPDSIRLEQRTEPVDPGHDIEPDGRPAASDTVRA